MFERRDRQRLGLENNQMIHLNAQQREELLEKYADSSVDSMDHQTLTQYAYDSIIDSLVNESDEDIIDTIEQTHPHLTKHLKR